MLSQTSQKRVLFPRTLTPVMVGGFLACLVLFTTLISLWNTPTATAATNGTINFQARLENAAGNIAPDGNYFIQFNLYNSASGGTALWTEQYQGSAFTCTAAGSTSTGATNNKITVKNGYLSANLGSLCTFPSTINWDQDLWVTLNVGGNGATASWDGEMNPRLHLTSVPYAFRAGQLAQFNNGNGFTSTLSLLQPTSGNQAFQIPDMGAAGTYNVCIANSAACGFALSSGNTNYIQNQIASAQTGSNFWISGTGRAATSLQAPLIDAATASTALNIGTTNASVINLNQNVTVANNKTFTANGNATFKAATASQSAFRISNTSSTPLINVDSTTLNLVSNSSFEPNITNWTNKGTATLSQTSSQSFSGFSSLQAITTATNSGVQTSSFTSPLLANTQYEVTFMAACSASVSTFTYGHQDVSGTDINASTTAVCNTNWQRYTYHFTTGATVTSPNIYMTLGSASSGTFWVDAVQVLQTNTTGAQPYSAGSVKIDGVITDPVVIRNVFNSTNAFEVQDATGHSNTLVADTANNQVIVGGALNATGNVTTNGNLIATGSSGVLSIYSYPDGGQYNIGANTSGTLAIFGSGSSTLNMNLLDGSLQTAGTTRLDNSGNLLNIGNITASGNIQQTGSSATNYFMGALGLGTANPQAASALTIANSSWISSVDAAGTGYVNMFQVNSNNQIQVGAALNIDGGIILPTNGGQLTLSDLPIDSTASAGTAESYTMRVGSTNALTVYGQADGSGNAQNIRVAVGSSISPAYTLDVGGDINTSGVYRVGGTAGATTTCSGGQVVQNQVIQGGIVTGGTCAAVGGGGSYVTLQGSTPGTPDTGNLNISGVGIFGNGVKAPSIDTASAVSLAIGATNASAITLGKTSGTTNIATTINGTVAVKPNSDSTTAFQIQNAAGTSLFTADTTTGQLNLGNVLNGTNMTFGNQTVSNVDSGNPDGNTIISGKFTTGATAGTLKSISVYVGNVDPTLANDKFRVAIYSDTGLNRPANLIAQSSEGVLSTSNIFNTLPVSATLAANTTYWLAYLTNTPNNGYNIFGFTGGTTNQYYSLNTTYGAFPSTVASGGFNTGIAPAFYGTFVGSGSVLSSVMTVSSSGNVGIGTTTPNATLQVAGTAAFQSTTNSTTAFQIQNAAGTNLLNVDTTNSAITLGSTTAAIAQTINLGSNATASSSTTVNIGSLIGASTTNIQAGTGSINLKSNSSSLTQSTARIVQGGTGDATLELNSSNISKSVFLGLENSSGGSFALSTSASNTGTASNSFVTPAYVQGTTAFDSTSDYSLSVAFSSNTTAGNAIIAAVTMSYYGDTAGIPFTCTDNQGDTFYTAITRDDRPNNQMTGVCYATNIHGGATTVTFSPKTYDAGNRGIEISEYSGIAKANPVDAVSAHVDTSTTTADAETSYSATTTQANDLIFGAITSPSNTATVTAGTGYTLRNNDVGGEGQTEDKILATAGTTAATFTYSAAGPYTAVMVAFKAATITSYGSVTNTDNLANPVFKVTQSGAATFKNVTDSTSAFQVQTSAGNTLLNADTSNARIGIGTNAPQYTLDVQGSNPSFQLASGSAVASTNLFSDNFNRANGALGSNWTTVNGTFAIASNVASVSSYTGGAPDQESYVSSITPQSPDYSVSATVSFNNQNITSETLLGVGGRITPVGTTDETGYFAYLDYTPGSTGYIELWKRVSGSWTEFSDKAYIFSNSGTYNLKLSMDGTTLQVYVNNVLYLNVTDTDITTAGTGAITACGNAYVMTWDNFSMDTVPSSNGMVQKLVGDKLYLQGNTQADASFMTYDLTNSRLGIGLMPTSGPRATLDVNGQVLIQSNGSSTRALSVNGASGQSYFAVDSYGGSVKIDPDGNAYNSGLWEGLTFGSSGCEGIVSNGATTDLEMWSGCNQAFTLNNDGTALFKNGTNSTTGLQVQASGGAAVLTVNTSSKRVCIAVATCTHALGVSGQIGASNTTISGTPDYAETIFASDDSSAADVVMADPNNNERVVKAVGAYNSAVTGIVSSGGPGVIIDHPEYYGSYDGNSTTGGIPIALAGRVPVHVTTENGIIHPGDYLTVSATKPGYAMKATHAGATIGKSYGYFDGTSGNTVLALVNISYYDPNDGNHLQSQSGSFDTLQAGSASFSSLNVSGATTLTSLTVTGNASFQGDVTVTGTLTSGSIVVNGHIITSGSTPTITVGNAAGQPNIVNGQPDSSTQPVAAITGTDSTGMVTVTTGANSLVNGSLVHIQFAQNFTDDYNVVVSASNDVATDLRAYTTKTSGGFDISIKDPAAGQTIYQFTYMVLGARSQ